MFPTNFLQWIEIIAAALGVFSLIAAITPNQTDNKISGFLLDIINLLGGNWGNARNKKKRKK
jgi:hypothetical protein